MQLSHNTGLLYGMRFARFALHGAELDGDTGSQP